MWLLWVGDGQDGEIAVHHAQDDAVPIGGALQRAQVRRDSEIIIIGYRQIDHSSNIATNVSLASPVVCNHDPVRNPEHPERLPPAVVVEDILVGLVELANHVEDALGDLGDQCPHHGSVPQVQHVQPAAGRGVQTIPSIC